MHPQSRARRYIGAATEIGMIPSTLNGIDCEMRRRARNPHESKFSPAVPPVPLGYKPSPPGAPQFPCVCMRWRALATCVFATRTFATRVFATRVFATRALAMRVFATRVQAEASVFADQELRAICGVSRWGCSACRPRLLIREHGRNGGRTVKSSFGLAKHPQLMREACAG